LLEALTGSMPKQLTHYTVGDRAMRAGDKTEVVGIPIGELPAGFWSWHRPGRKW
jgi:hypothetical protein